jgi:glycosyltransferase involved in cell wall biosynthesis
MRMRIGILCSGFMAWGGGLDFLRTVIQSLLAASSDDMELHLILPDRGFRYAFDRRNAEFRRFIKRTIFQRQVSSLIHGKAREFLRSSLGDGQYRVKFHHIGTTDEALVALCKSLNLDALAPSMRPLGHDFRVPWMGYMYDFQHRYLPQYFTPEVCRSRDLAFAEMLGQAPVVIVNAQTVAADCAKFFPGGTAEISALPFAAAPERIWLEDHPELIVKYQIGTRYFMISNQFWMHKRHDVAFEAFHKVAEQHEYLNLVCTGDADDWRHPKYFGSLVEHLESWRIRDRVRILGMIPKREQIELMKGAIAVIQPTEFEGGPGGGSVYDAISIGTPVIASDIPVNREIASHIWRYFHSGDSDALAEAMSEIVSSSPARPDAQTLIAQGEQRRRSCGETISIAVKRAIALSTTSGRMESVDRRRTPPKI